MDSAAVLSKEEQMPLNRNELFARVDNDIELLGELIEIFMEDYPSLIAQIEEAIQKNDSQALRKSAHALKGSVANFCAPEAVELSRQLEVMGAEGNLASAASYFQKLQAELQQVTQALKQLSTELNA